jgi:hypothetical protein
LRREYDLKPMLSALARIFLILAFLVAQSAGIAHQAWHEVGGLAAATESAAADGKAPNKNLLCDFHTALASVLGAIHGDAPAIDAVASLQTAFISADVPAARLSALAPRSRAPPALL